MAVLVKGMEMPRSCLNCKFPRACQAITRRIDEMVRTELFPKDHRHSDCPLTEVPEPHGRLIDADKLKSYWEPDHSIYFDADYFIHTIDTAQTIIPASEEGET